MNNFLNMFTKPPKLGSASGNPQPGNRPQGTLPSSNDLHNQFNDKLQQIKTIISQLNKNRASQKSFNDSVRDQLAGFTIQLSTVIIPAVKNLKSQITSLREKSNRLNENIEEKQNENAQIIENVNDEEMQRLLKRIQQLEDEKGQLLDSQRNGELEKQQIEEQLREKDQQLREAEQQISTITKNADRETQQLVAEIEKNRAEIESLKQQKGQLEQIITDSMSIMDEIIAELNGLNVADNNDVLNNSIENVKQNIDELTQLLTGNVQAPPASNSPPTPSSQRNGPSFMSPFQPVPKQSENMSIGYPVWINRNLTVGNPPLTLGALRTSLANCNAEVCREALTQISSSVNPTEAEIIEILLQNGISIQYDGSFQSTQGNDAVMSVIKNFLDSEKNISSGGMKKRRMRTSKKYNKKTKKSNKKTKKQRGGWNYDNKRHKRGSRSSRSTKRRTPR
jgi:hypothetical protein